jgi:hypothetical protein
VVLSPVGSLAPPSLSSTGGGAGPAPSVHAQLSRLELAALQLSRQYELMLHSMQDSEKHLSNMTLHYVTSLHQACKVSIPISTQNRCMRRCVCKPCTVGLARGLTVWACRLSLLFGFAVFLLLRGHPDRHAHKFDP